MTKILCALLCALTISCGSVIKRDTVFRAAMIYDRMEQAQTEEEEKAAIADFVGLFTTLDLSGIEVAPEDTEFAAWLVARFPEFKQYESLIASGMAYMNTYSN